MASGYWQIKVSEESQEKTAFITQSGLYEFRVMPSGPWSISEADADDWRVEPKTEEGTDFVRVFKQMI